MTPRRNLVFSILAVLLSVTSAAGLYVFLSPATYQSLAEGVFVIASWPAAGAVAVFATLAIFGQQPVRLRYRIAVASVSAASSLCVFYAVANALNPVQLLNYPAPDYTVLYLTLSAISLALYAVAATIYWVAVAKIVSARARRWLALILLLSCIPVANVAGTIALLVINVRRERS